MITFLAPAALAAAVLLAIPVVVHLFKPRKVRRTPFSSLRWLHLTQQKLARRIKWHQVLLFGLRAAFILLLVLAAAKPIFNPRGQSGGAVERFVVLDVSRSMGYRAGQRQTPLEAGKQAAAQIINRGVAGDRTAVLLTGSKTQSLGPLSGDPAGYLAALKRVQPSAGDADLVSALHVIRPMLAARRADADAEIVFITDNHRGGWREAPIREFVHGLPEPVKVRVVDVSVSGAQNAWIADARLIPPTKPSGKPVIRVQIGCVGDAGKARTLRVSEIQGLREISRPVTPEPGILTRVDLEIPAVTEGRGQVARISIEPGDALRDDDIFFLSLDPPTPTKVLLIEPDDTQIESMRPGFYLRAALGALSATDERAVAVETKTPGEAGPGDFEQADVVLLADVSQLSDAATTALEERVKGGAGLAIFLGPSVDLGYYNERLFRPLLPSESLLPAPLQPVTNAQPQRLDPLTDIRWSHSLLAPLHDPVLGDLPQTAFRTYHQIGPLTQGAEVLASIDGQTPAIIERNVGAGRVVLFNTTANDAWSDLPRRKGFLPLIDRLLSHLTGGAGASRSFNVGESIALPLPGVAPDAAVTVTTPSGKTLTPGVQAQAGRSVMRLDGLPEPGVYHVKADGEAAAAETFVVQAGRGDSALTPIDSDTLRNWWRPAEIEIVAADAATKGAAIASQRAALWPALVALACIVLLAEMFLVHWLCPRMNPGVVAPVVPRRGLFRPTNPPPQQHEAAI